MMLFSRIRIVVELFGVSVNGISGTIFMVGPPHGPHARRARRLRDSSFRIARLPVRATQCASPAPCQHPLVAEFQSLECESRVQGVCSQSSGGPPMRESCASTRSTRSLPVEWSVDYQSYVVAPE